MQRPMSFSNIGGQEDKTTAKFNLREKYASPIVKHEGTGGFQSSAMGATNSRGIVIPQLIGINQTGRLPSQATDNQGFLQYGQQLETSGRPLSSRGNKIFQDQQRPSSSSQSNIPKEQRLNSNNNGVFQQGQNVNYQSQQADQNLVVPQVINASFRENISDRQQQLAVQKPMLLIAQSQPRNPQPLGYSSAQNSNAIQQQQQRTVQQFEESRLFADDQLLKKAEAAQQKLLESSQVLEIIVQKRRQIFAEYDACLDRIDAQKKRIHECSKRDSKKFFIQKTPHELMLFKDKKAELTRLKEECQKMLEKHEALEVNLRNSGITINASNTKTLPSSNGLPPPQAVAMKEDFEFESEFLSLSDQSQQRIGIISVAVENYKKFYRIDRTSNKFGEMQRQLIDAIQNFEENQRQQSTRMSELVKDFVEQLRGLKIEVEENSNFHDILLASYQESFDTVEQLLFYRQDKIQELKERINNAIRRPLCQIFCNQQQPPYSYSQQQSQLMTSNYGNFNQESAIRNNNNNSTFISTFMKSQVGSANLIKLRVQLDKEIKDIDQIAHKIKKDAKNTHSSAHSMFFVQLRSKLISKIVSEINESILGVLSELSRVVDYATGSEFANDLSYSSNIIANSQQLVTALTNHATTSIFQQQQTMQLLQQSQLTLSQLYELENKLETQLNEEQFKIIIGTIVSGILNDLTAVIAELNEKQSIVLPLIQYQTQMSSLSDKKQEIQLILSQSTQITTAFTQNPSFFLNFAHNCNTLPEVLQVKKSLADSKVVLNELIEFINNAKRTNLDQTLVDRDSHAIQTMFSSLQYNQSNIDIIANILEATVCLAPQNVSSFNFKVNPDQSTLESALPKKAEEVANALNSLQKLKQKPLLGSEAENRLLSSLSNVERVIAGTQNVLLTWIKSAESLLSQIQLIRKTVPQQNIQDKLEQIMNASLQELTECINDAITDRDAVNYSRNIQNSNNGDPHAHNQNDLPGIFLNEIKIYNECIVRFALNLENKLLNPYSAKYLLNWLENHHDTAFEHISYLFDLSDLIKYSQKNPQDGELDLQLKLLRSRVTESIQNESSINALFNQKSLLADMQLELILEVVLDDSMIYDYQIFIELVVIGQYLNSAIRSANSINQLLLLKQLRIPKDLHEAKQLLECITRYSRLLNRQNQVIINPQVANLMTAQLKSIIQQQISVNTSAVTDLLGQNQTSDNALLLQGIASIYDMAVNFVEVYELTTQEFVSIASSQSQAFSKIQKKLTGIEYILHDSFVSELKQNKYLPVSGKITQNSKLAMSIGLFESIVDLDKVFEYCPQESLLDWKNLLEASLSTQPRAQISHNIKPEALTALQKAFISTYEAINKVTL